MKPLLNIIIILSLVIVGCSRELPHNDVLIRAEQQVFEHPDSVISILEPFWGDTTLTTADRALYGLVYTEALHRSGLSTEADSLIRFSRQYYEQTGDKARLARALLHHGIILYKQQLTNKAVLAMKRAEQLNARQDNPAFTWYLCSVLGDINDNVNNQAQTLRYYKLALAAAQRCRNDEWTVQALNNIALTFDLLGETDSLRYYTSQAKPYALKTNGEVRATYLVNQASYLLQDHRRKEARDYLLKAQSISPTDRGAKLLADVYLSEGDTTAAVQQWYQLVNSYSPDVAIQSYHQLIRFLNRRGYTEQATRYSLRLNEVYHNLYERTDATDIIDMQTQYDEQQQERRQYQTVIALLAAIILLTAVGALLFRYNRRRIDQLNARFAESQQQYHLTRTALTRMRHQQERQQRENSRQLKTANSRLHAAASRGRAADDEDITTLAQLSFALSPRLQELLSPLSQKEQSVCLLTRHNFLPTEIATLTISTPQAITNLRVRLLKKLFNQTGGAKDFDTAIRNI